MGNERFQPSDEGYEAKIREDFARQGLMKTIPGELLAVAPGEVQVGLGFRDFLTQQHGFLHAGVIATILDNACGYAAYTLMPAGAQIMTVEFKVNFLSPARGERFVATGKVVKPGRTLSFCQGEMVAVQGGVEKTIATMSATLISLPQRPSTP